MGIDSFTFEFNQRSSSEFGIYATSYDALIPKKRERRRKISFRHGSHVSGETFYEDRPVRLRCFWLNDKLDNLSRADIREITAWLSERGRLVLDVEPDKYYVGELYEPHELMAHYNRMRDDKRTTDGSFELVFICDPFAYGKQTVQPLLRGNNTIEYKGTAETPTLIVLRNTGNTPVSTVVLTATSTTGG